MGLKGQVPWADPATPDQAVLAKRTSYEGPIDFDNGRPLNPRGRTGLRGRGALGRWGPNLAADLLLTREHPVTRKLQIVLVKRQDATTTNATPGDGPKSPYFLANLFRRRSSAALMSTPHSSARGSDRKSRRSSSRGSGNHSLDSTNQSAVASDHSQSDDDSTIGSPQEQVPAKGAKWGVVREAHKQKPFRSPLYAASDSSRNWAFPGTLVELPTDEPIDSRTTPNPHRRTSFRPSLQRAGTVSHITEDVIEQLLTTFENEVFSHSRDTARVKKIRSMMRDTACASNAFVVYCGYVDGACPRLSAIIPCPIAFLRSW